MRRPPASEAALGRLTSLHPRRIDLSLGRVRRLLAALGGPERRLPPVIHVAGTNGKGSTIAFARAVAEAAGLSVHVYTSPHLVRFHERIVLAGAPVAEADLAAALEECESANGGAPATLFEVTTAAALLLFSRRPADLLLLETGLGGRLDATNVVASPAVTVITPVSVDHAEFLGGDLAGIAREKAGILRPGVPCVLAGQEAAAAREVASRAAAAGAPLVAAGRDWDAAADGGGMVYRDRGGATRLPPPALAGPHQVQNAGAAIAALRCWRAPGAAAEASGVASAVWPGRFQRLGAGPLAALAGGGLWVDGGHNPAAGRALAAAVAGLGPGPPPALVCAMQGNKDAAGFLAPFAGVAGRVVATALPGGGGIDPAALAAAARRAGLGAGAEPALADAVRRAGRGGGRVVVCGSLRLAGAALAASGAAPGGAGAGEAGGEAGGVRRRGRRP